MKNALKSTVDGVVNHPLVGRMVGNRYLWYVLLIVPALIVILLGCGGGGGGGDGGTTGT